MSLHYNSLCNIFHTEPGEPISRQEIKLVPTDEFQRFSSAGFITVKAIAPPQTDFHPPSRITDLEVIEALYDESKITLTWTAVGDDLDSGTGKSPLLLSQLISCTIIVIRVARCKSNDLELEC